MMHIEPWLMDPKDPKDVVYEPLLNQADDNISSLNIQSLDQNNSTDISPGNIEDDDRILDGIKEQDSIEAESDDKNTQADLSIENAVWQFGQLMLF